MHCSVWNTCQMTKDVCFDHLLGDVDEFAPSEEVLVAFDSAARVALGKEDGAGAREGAFPGGANI